MATELNFRILISAVDQGARKLIGGTQTDLAKLGGQMKKAGAAMTMVGGAIVGSLMAATAATAQYGDELAKASAKTGVATESLGRLRWAAEQSNVSFGTLEAALFRMQRGAAEAAAGTGTAKQAFDALGISVTDATGKTKDAEQLMIEVAQALSQVDDAGQRAALTFLIFGRQGMELLPLLMSGEEGIRKLGEEAEKMGLAMSGEAAAASEAFNDQLNELKTALGGLWRVIGTNLIPIITDLAEWLTDVANRMSAWAERNPWLSSTLTKIALAIGGILAVAGPMLLLLGQALIAWNALTAAQARNAAAATAAGNANLAAAGKAAAGGKLAGLGAGLKGLGLAGLGKVGAIGAGAAKALGGAAAAIGGSTAAAVGSAVAAGVAIPYFATGVGRHVEAGRQSEAAMFAMGGQEYDRGGVGETIARVFGFDTARQRAAREFAEQPVTREMLEAARQINRQQVYGAN